MPGFAEFQSENLRDLSELLTDAKVSELMTLLENADFSLITKSEASIVTLSAQARELPVIQGWMRGPVKPNWIKNLFSDKIEIDTGEFLKVVAQSLQDRTRKPDSMNVNAMLAILASFNKQNLLAVDRITKFYAEDIYLDTIKAIELFQQKFQQLIGEIQLGTQFRPQYIGQDAAEIKRQEAEAAEARYKKISAVAVESLQELLNKHDFLPVPPAQTEGKKPPAGGALIKTLSRTASGFKGTFFSKSSKKLSELTSPADTLADDIKELSDYIKEYKQKLSALFILYPHDTFVFLQEKVLSEAKLNAVIKLIEEGDDSDRNDIIPPLARTKEGQVIVPTQMQDFYNRINDLSAVRHDVEEKIDHMVHHTQPKEKASQADLFMQLERAQAARLSETADQLRTSKEVRRASIAVTPRGATTERDDIEVAKKQGDMYLSMKKLISAAIPTGYSFEGYQIDPQNPKRTEPLSKVIMDHFQLKFKSGTRTEQQMNKLESAINAIKFDLPSKSMAENARAIVDQFDAVFDKIKPQPKEKGKLTL